MRFYFPDSQDQVYPGYDFVRDEYPVHRIRQRDDLYAHEVLTVPPYHGLLVSKAIIDGSVSGSGKYSQAQRQRLRRLGIRNFFRLPRTMETLGDCGAFNYVSEQVPPYTTQEVLDFYVNCGFDAGVSIDHVILGFRSDDSDVPVAWRERQHLSLSLAADFMDQVTTSKVNLQPVGAAQGFSPASYAQSVYELQQMGYRRIALGGMVPLKTHEILASLEAVNQIRERDVELHLLGITRVEAMDRFAELGVTSFDSTSAFRQAFMDAHDNYYLGAEKFAAIRVPQVDGNPLLRRLILSGQVNQSDALQLERACLAALRSLGSSKSSQRTALSLLLEYESVAAAGKPKRTYAEAYERILEAQPWRSCPCNLCRQHGVEIVIFRGTERNKRRGFHNMTVVAQQMKDLRLARRPK